MVTRDFVQAGKFWVKNESKTLFGDPQEVHLVCENIHSAPNVYFTFGAERIFLFGRPLFFQWVRWA